MSFFSFFRKRNFFHLLFCLFYLWALPVPANTGNKRAYIITGPESSGSKFIATVIAHVLGKSQIYKGWEGNDMCGQLGDAVIVFHFSQPGYISQTFYTADQFHQLFDGYELYFVITTRDQNIVDISKRKRFSYRKEHLINKHRKMSKKILSEIIRTEKHFIWSYETQNYLKEAYFQLLYDFLELKSDFFPNDLFDANKKYISP